MKSTQTDMLRGPLAGGILRYTIPIILTSVLQLLFNAADLFVVGNYCGSITVAAVGSTSALTNLIINLFMGLSVGAGVAVAHAIGSREAEAIRRTVHTAIPLAILSGMVLTVVGVAISEDLLRLMSTPENVLPLSALYMRVFFCGMTFNMVYNFCTSILRAAGDTRSPLIILVAAGVINVVLNIIFVTALDMSVAGVALATAISQAVSAVCVVIVLMRRTDACRLYWNQLHIYPVQLAKIIRIGLPAGIQGAMFSISNVIIQSSINSFGDVLMSANATVSTIESFCFATVNGFHQTAVNYIGQNTGACQFGRVRRILWLCTGYAAFAGFLVGASATFFAKDLMGLYITDSPAAIQAGMVRMMFTTAIYFIYGIMDVITGALRGLGASLVSMLITVLGVCGIRLLWIGTVFQLPAFHTPQSLYASYPISWTITLVAQLTAFVIFYKKLSVHSVD